MTLRGIVFYVQWLSFLVWLAGCSAVDESGRASSSNVAAQRACSSGSVHATGGQVVNVRGGPRPDAPVVGHLAEGTSVAIVGSYNSPESAYTGPSGATELGWFRVHPSEERWVAAAYVTLDEQTDPDLCPSHDRNESQNVVTVTRRRPAVGKVPERAIAPVRFVRAPSGEFAEVRAHPLLPAARALPTGATVTSLGRRADDAGWVQVGLADGAEGFVQERYLSPEIMHGWGPAAKQTHGAGERITGYEYRLPARTLLANKAINLALSASRLNGLILPPQAVVSYIDAIELGEASDQRSCASHSDCNPGDVCACIDGSGCTQRVCDHFDYGYFTGGQWGRAGGVCGTATTFYRASLCAADIDVLEQFSHGIFFDFYQYPGADAEVYLAPGGASRQDLTLANVSDQTLVTVANSWVDRTTDEFVVRVEFYGQRVSQRRVQVSPVRFHSDTQRYQLSRHVGSGDRNDTVTQFVSKSKYGARWDIGESGQPYFDPQLQQLCQVAP
jgi:hypothetical protein